VYVLEFDHGRFMNHSPTPNTDFTNPALGLATCAIAAGEEITCDYRQFCIPEDLLFLQEAS
jgi:SET domain-containing protein